MVKIARILKLKNGGKNCWNFTNFKIKKWLKSHKFFNWKMVEIARISKLKNSWNCTNFEIENGWKCTKFKIEKWLKLHEFQNWRMVEIARIFKLKMVENARILNWKMDEIARISKLYKLHEYKKKFNFVNCMNYKISKFQNFRCCTNLKIP